MSGFFRNRLSGAMGSPGSTPLPGLWQLEPGGGPVWLNSIPVQAADFLVPDALEGWSLRSGDSAGRLDGAFARGAIIDELEAGSIDMLGALLQERVEAGAGWLEWLEVTPLVPGISEAVGLRPLETIIQEHLGSLEQVCCRPRARLQIRVERTPVARARRVPPRAASHLAAHTEDWDRPLLRGVLPKRILAEVREEHLDIYENRVAARLIDHLHTYLDGRVCQIRRVLRVFEDVSDHSGALQGTHWRNKRMAAIWGETIDADEGKRRAGAVLRVLETLLHRVLGLMDTPLYRAVSRRAYISRTLRMTNILANDLHYRQVVRLWRAWARYAAISTRTPREVYQAQQARCRSFDRYCLLLVIRALDQLDVAPADEDIERPLAPGERRALEPGNGLALHWQEDGTIRLTRGSGSILRVVPVLSNLAAAPAAEAVEARIAVLSAAFEAGEKQPTLVLHASSGRENTGRLPDRTGHRLHTIGNEPTLGLPPGLGILPVSPWEIDSVERVARALRWHLTGARILAYPPRIDAPPPGTLALPSADWIQAGSNGQWLLLRTPQPAGWAALDIEGALRRAEANHADRTEQHEQLAKELRHKRGDRREMARLNPLVKQARREMDDARDSRDGLRRFRQDMEAARDVLDRLVQCPVCRSRANPRRDVSIGAQESIRCRCQGCAATWGTRVCGGCKARVPFLLPGQLTLPAQRRPGWLDRSIGSDVLAVPCDQSSGAGLVVCAQCGECL